MKLNTSRQNNFYSLQFHVDNNLWSDNKLHPIFHNFTNTFLCKNVTMATHPYKYILITSHSKQNIYNIAEHSMIRLLTIFKCQLKQPLLSLNFYDRLQDFQFIILISRTLHKTKCNSIRQKFCK